MCTPGMGVDSRGASPLQEDQAHDNGPQLLAKGKGVSARRGLEEAGGKAANRRTGTPYAIEGLAPGASQHIMTKPTVRGVG